MHLTRTAYGLWVSGFLAESILLLVLLKRRVQQKEPWFVAWIGFNSASTVLLFSVSRVPTLYFLSFWGRALLDLFLQLAVLGEIASTITTSSSADGVDRLFVRRRICFALPLALVAVLAEQPAASGSLEMFFTRANLFMTVVFCVTLGSIIGKSRKLGLAWSDDVTRKSYGLVVWNLFSFLLDSLHSDKRTARVFADLEYLRSASFLLVLVYWSLVYGRVSMLRRPPALMMRRIEAYLATKDLPTENMTAQESDLP